MRADVCSSRYRKVMAYIFGASNRLQIVTYPMHYNEPSQTRFERLCMDVRAYCDRLAPKPSLDDARQWVRTELLSELGELESFCRRYDLLDDAERLGDLSFRLSHCMVSVLFPSDEIGAIEGLWWTAKDIGELIGGLPNKLRTYTTVDMCRELEITSATLTKYARMSGVRPTKRGGRDRRYTSDERLQILRVAALYAPATTAEIARDTLDEIESKSKAQK